MDTAEACDHLVDHASWGDPAAQHARLAGLRRESPVTRRETPGFVPYWHVTRHEDVWAVERAPERWLTEPRSFIGPIADEEKVRAMTGGDLKLIESLVSMDDPKHYKHRAVTQAWFMPSNLKAVDARVREIAEAAVERMAGMDGACDVAADVASLYPLRVIMEILGIPEEDEPKMLTLTQELFGNADPATARNLDGDALAGIVGTYMEFVAYFEALTQKRRANPTDDVASVIANATVDGAPMGQREAMGYYTIVATAGHDTTSYVTTRAVKALADDPALLKRLQDDPEGTAPLIVAEALRLTAPVRHFVRTATEDTDVGGQTVPKGEAAVVWFPSACRDEAVFENPDAFDVDREQAGPSPAFGTGPHICLGMHLAKLEITRFLEALGRRVARIEVTGEPAYLRSNFVGGIRSLPVAFEMRD